MFQFCRVCFSDDAMTATPVSNDPQRANRFFRCAMYLPVVAIGGLLAYDRYRLGKEYLFKYTDEDQTCMWYAAHDLLHGRIAEPAFYGQNYNSCLEGFLAAPLVALHVPYNIACPLTTLVLGLLPFLLIALIACRRGHALTAAAVLLVPLILPIRYAMICGIPRGFINGIAVAMLPVMLLLPPAMSPSKVSIAPALTRPRFLKWLDGAMPALRYFFAAFFSVAAAQVNPNCVILLVPVAMYAIFTRFRQWKFWLFSLTGILAAAPYPYYVYEFYHVLHPDYVIYLRNNVYHWGYEYFTTYLHFAAPASGPSPVFADLVPLPISAILAPKVLLFAFIALALLLLIRVRIAAFLAAVSGIAITFISFASERVNQGLPSNTASYSYSRMYLALPVVFAWLLFLLTEKPWPRFAGTVYSRALKLVGLAILFFVGLYVFVLKQQQRHAAIIAEVDAPGFVICPAIPVSQIYATAGEVKRIAAAHHADLLIVGGGDRQKNLAYAIPALVGIETLFPDFERRGFRLVEENSAAHDNILFIHYNVAGASRAGGGIVVKVDDEGNLFDPRTAAAAAANAHLHSIVVPPIDVLPAHGSNAYHLAELRYRMPRLPVAPR